MKFSADWCPMFLRIWPCIVLAVLPEEIPAGTPSDETCSCTKLSRLLLPKWSCTQTLESHFCLNEEQDAGNHAFLGLHVGLKRQLAFIPVLVYFPRVEPILSNHIKELFDKNNPIAYVMSQ